MFKKLSFIVRDYFGFSRTETRGLFFLLTLITLALVSMIFLEKWAYESNLHSDTDHLILDSLIQQLNDQEFPAGLVNLVDTEGTLFNFNPNHISFENLLLLGIDETLSQRIIKYRSKGGKFVRQEDLMKIYGFPQALYEKLKPYIELPGEKVIKPISKEIKQQAALPNVEKPSHKVIEEKRSSYDINQADSLQLSALKGIGSVLSARIVKYREQLGGYYDIEQLKEIYNINEMALMSLKEYTFVKKDFVPKKIKINEVDFKSLLKHPYIDYELCKSIMNHRRIYGNFSSPEELKEVYHMNEELLVKLLPYIVI